MKGQNILHLCQSEMVSAMDYYVKNKLFIDKDVVVKSVKVAKNESVHFDITIEGKKAV